MTLPHRRAAVPAALGLALGAVLLSAAPAAAGDTSLKLTPETVQAGYVVGLEASCADNSKSATVESDAFGSVPVKPQNGVLTGTAVVPERTAAGTYPVKLNCAGTEFAMDSLTVVSAVQPTHGPATGFGGTASSGGGTLLLTAGIATIVAGGALGLVAARRRGPAAPRPAGRGPARRQRLGA